MEPVVRAEGIYGHVVGMWTVFGYNVRSDKSLRTARWMCYGVDAIQSANRLRSPVLYRSVAGKPFLK